MKRVLSEQDGVVCTDSEWLSGGRAFKVDPIVAFSWLCNECFGTHLFGLVFLHPTLLISPFFLSSISLLLLLFPHHRCLCLHLFWVVLALICSYWCLVCFYVFIRVYCMHASLSPLPLYLHPSKKSFFLLPFLLWFDRVALHCSWWSYPESQIT